MARPSSRNGTSALGAARRFRVPRDIGSPAPLASLFLMKPITSFPNFFFVRFYTFLWVHRPSIFYRSKEGYWKSMYLTI